MVVSRAVCANATMKSRRSARRWLRKVTVERRGRIAANSGNKVGRPSDSRMNSGPRQRDADRQGPADDQCREAGRRGQRTPQIVEHLPQADERHAAVAAAMCGGAGVAAAENPRQQLPVAANPAVLAQRGDVVPRRKVLDHFHIGRQAGAREDAFEQIVAEQRAFRHASGERGLEGVDVVDALAGERAFA